MSKTKPQTKPSKEPKVIVITSAAQLQKLTTATVACRFKLDNQIIAVPVQRMTTDTAEQVRALRREALPPWKKERNAYDEYEPKYLEAVAANERKARSFIIYSHCPVIAQEQPGLSDKVAIHEHVKKYFTDNILEIISLTIQAGGLERVEERVDFTSPPDLES